MSPVDDPRSKPAALSQVHGARLLSALEAAKSAALRATSEQREAISALHGQQQDLQAAQESGFTLGARGRDVRNSLLLLREAVDRARLTALNAGLEGARLGDSVGKALMVMGDEVRHLLARAVDALQEHAALLAEVDRDRDRHLEGLTQLGASARVAGSTLARAQSETQLTSALLGELGTDLGELLGTDPEVARLLAESAEQVSRVATSLRELAQRSPEAATAVQDLLRTLLCIAPKSEDASE